MTTDWQTTLQGAYAVPELVGREDILKTIFNRIQDVQKKTSCMIFLVGPGGIGKTRLLLEIIARCKEIPGIKVCDRLIDAYHLLYHTPYEMAQVIYEGLKPSVEPFLCYEQDLHAFERLRLSGEAVQIEEKREQALESFIEELKELTKKQRVVIVLDTIERFIYSDDHSAAYPFTAEAWGWLMEKLMTIDDVILVAAGRPESERLITDVVSKNVENRALRVEPFSPEESKAYFDAAAKMARQNQVDEIAIRLESFSPQEKEQAYQITGGQPILLALLADYISSGGLLTPFFDEVSRETGEDVSSVFKSKVVDRLLSVPRIGETLRYMAILPKGVNVSLLSAVMELFPDLALEYLREIEKLSFVKVRRSHVNAQTDTYFLHDELYDLFQRAVFSDPIGYKEKQRIYPKIIECFEQQFKDVQESLASLFGASVEEGISEINYEELNDLLAHRTEILTALLYYRLREDPPKGFRRWFRYDHEAIISGDLFLSNQLQLELLSYLRDLQTGKVEREEGWDNDLVEWSLLLRPVKHAWAQGKNQELLAEARKLEESNERHLTDPLKRAMLWIWKAYALIASSPPEAQETLEKVISLLVDYRENVSDEMHHWLAQALLAFAYRVRGYADRVQELINSAIEHYRKAAVQLREVDLKIEMATVNNDLGFALAQRGEWDDARSLVLNALELRQKLGLGMQVASSLNTLGIIDAYEGKYSEAIDYSTKSLNLARAVENKRREGLALIALAEAIRRQSSAWTTTNPKYRMERLDKAYAHANEALAIFQDLGEKSRQVEALIEKGCARRDAVRLSRELPISAEDREKWVEESRQDLIKAAQIAEGLVEKPGVHYRQVDALVDLAWLGFYAGGEEGEILRKEAEAQAEALLKDYELSEGTPKPAIYGRPEYQPLLSTQLGKLHVLRGHHKYNLDQQAWTTRIDENHPASDALKESYRALAQEYFLGLENTALFSPEARGFRLAKQQIFDRLKKLRPQNLKLFVEYINELETKYNIPKGESQLCQLLIKRALI